MQSLLLMDSHTGNGNVSLEEPRVNVIAYNKIKVAIGWILEISQMPHMPLARSLTIVYARNSWPELLLAEPRHGICSLFTRIRTTTSASAILRKQRRDTTDRFHSLSDAIMSERGCGAFL